MHVRIFFLVLLPIIAFIFLGGCGSSGETQSEQSPAGEPRQDQVSPGVAQQPDSLRYPESTMADSSVSSGATSIFAVQIGAYKLQDNADRIAAMARERFRINVRTIPDAATGLIKVYVGEFATKDEARRFRDDMAQRYAVDYNDAWVSEIPAK